MTKVWFITGTSKGFGRIWAEAALERGDQVVATARDPRTLDALVEAHGDAVLPLALDVTDKDAVTAAVRAGHERFGRLDVVVNNAGFGHFGMVEELTEDEARAQLETNFFGALWVTQAVLPILREQAAGHILQVSSIGGVNAFINVGIYHASKWALEGLSQSLSLETRDLGIHVTLVEPTGYPTDWRGPSSSSSEPLAAYDALRERRAEQLARMRSRDADPLATAPVILELVDLPEPPLRLFLGDGPLAMIKDEYGRRIAEWERFDALAVRAHGER